MMESRSRSVLDTPLEPVIGLAEGETRWRSMTPQVKQRRRRHCEFRTGLWPTLVDETKRRVVARP